MSAINKKKLTSEGVVGIIGVSVVVSITGKVTGKSSSAGDGAKPGHNIHNYCTQTCIFCVFLPLSCALKYLQY